jgi:hypothetical protein
MVTMLQGMTRLDKFRFRVARLGPKPGKDRSLSMLPYARELPGAGWN